MRGWVLALVVEGGIGGLIWCKQCIHTYVNAKMAPVETVPGIRGGDGGEKWRGEFKYDIFDIL
jgi:hypothetical protein